MQRRDYVTTWWRSSSWVCVEQIRWAVARLCDRSSASFRASCNNLQNQILFKLAAHQPLNNSLRHQLQLGFGLDVSVISHMLVYFNLLLTLTHHIRSAWGYGAYVIGSVSLWLLATWYFRVYYSRIMLCASVCHRLDVHFQHLNLQRLAKVSLSGPTFKIFSNYEDLYLK